MFRVDNIYSQFSLARLEMAIEGLLGLFDCLSTLCVGVNIEVQVASLISWLHMVGVKKTKIKSCCLLSKGVLVELVKRILLSVGFSIVWLLQLLTFATRC